MDNLSPLVAFAGGLVSLLSPCILPLIPVYIASLAGPDIFQGEAAGHRLTIFFHSLSFVFGFSIIFILLGSSVGLIGAAVSANLTLVRRLSGSLMVLLGLFMLAAIKVPQLNYEKRLASTGSAAGGYIRSLVIGILFALAWTPCVGPVLAGILALALNSHSAWQGSSLLAFYSLGVGLPFIVIGLAFDSLSPVLKRISRYSVYIYIFSGLLLIAVGSLILINRLSWFSV